MCLKITEKLYDFVIIAYQENNEKAEIVFSFLLESQGGWCFV